MLDSRQPGARLARKLLSYRRKLAFGVEACLDREIEMVVFVGGIALVANGVSPASSRRADGSIWVADILL